MSILHDLSVRTKLVILLVAFSVVPIVAMYSAFLNKEDDIKRMAQETLRDQATQIGETIDRNLFERYGDVQAFGYNTVAYDSSHWGKGGDDNPLIVAMNNYVKAYGLYPLMILVGTDGRVLGVNSVDMTGKSIPSKPIYNENFKDAKWFKDAMDGKFLEGKNGFTGTAVQPPEKSDLVAKATGMDGYSLAFSAPVRDTNGKLVGVWVNFADMSLVDDIVGAFRPALLEKGWKNPDLMVVDKAGTILVDYEADQMDSSGKLKHDFDNILAKNLVTLGVGAAKQATGGQAGYSEEFNPDSKSIQVFGYNHTDGAYNYSGLGWSVLIGLEKEEAYFNVNAIEKGMTIAGALALLAALVIGVFIGGAAAKPLRRSTDIMLALAEGNLQVDVPPAKGKDEINAILRSLQTFKDNGLRMEAMKLEAARKEKEAQDMQHKMMLDLADKFEGSVGQIVGTIAAASTELHANAESLSTIADETTKQATAVAAATEEASVSVQTVASSAEELSSSINEISRQVTESNRMTSEAVKEVKNTDQTVVSLAEAASQIGGVVKLIQDIAEQTNLLALNATIEAARAGEAGKGFAVVASEVKSLANQTAKVTEEISNKISAMQGVTTTAVTAIRGIGSTIEKVSSIISSIASAVEEQSAATKEIANNVSQASAGTSEVAGSITNVTQAATESRGASTDVLGAAKELSTQSERLKNEMGGFLKTIRAA